MVLNVLTVISNQLLALEQQRQDAIEAYNKAQIGIETLNKLTENMLKASQHGHEADSFAGVEEAKKA